jgi:hypothetical protein
MKPFGLVSMLLLAIPSAISLIAVRGSLAQTTGTGSPFRILHLEGAETHVLDWGSCGIGQFQELSTPFSESHFLDLFGDGIRLSPVDLCVPILFDVDGLCIDWGECMGSGRFELQMEIEFRSHTWLTVIDREQCFEGDHPDIRSDSSLEVFPLNGRIVVTEAIWEPIWGPSPNPTVDIGRKLMLSPGTYRFHARGENALSYPLPGGCSNAPALGVRIRATEIASFVPQEHPSIQAAIDAAPVAAAWQILVSEGTYNEAIDFKGKAITLKAVGARANTIIDGTGLSTSVVRAVTGETSATVFEGFTIRNGPVGSERNSLRLGGGMYIANASPTVRNCAFVNNAAGYGGGLYGLYSDALVENCTFSQNFATSDAGGLQFFGGSPVIRNCVISDNLSTYRGGGAHLVQWVSGFPTLEGCTVTGNRSQVSEGGGVSVVPDLTAGVKCVVADCTISGNTAQGRGGGLHAPVNTVGAPQAGVVLANNTICGNTSAISKRENSWLLFDDGGNTICDCFSDVDGNGTVDFGDLAFALLFVGDLTDPDFIQPDQDMNGLIDTGDVALLLLNFGPCS